MKRLLSILSVVLLVSCENSEISKTCYTCTRYTTAKASQTTEFCDKAEYEKYFAEMKIHPETSYINCANKE